MNPYLFQGPGYVSVSGGRTSAFMLAKIVEAHGGKLPQDVIAIFCNTGLEHPKTLDFLREVERRICPIVWLEYRHAPDQEPGHSWQQVRYETASRNGEPFDQIIQHRSVLPNPRARYCTAELKVRTANRYVQSLGWGNWNTAVGLRADEPRRLAKIAGDGSRQEVECPIARAGHTLDDVLAYWRKMPFDLELPNGDNAFGNCTLCFLKTTDKLLKIIRADPSVAQWWIEKEALRKGGDGDGSRFRKDRPGYEALLRISRTQGLLFEDQQGDESLPCNCTD